jgi:hypothetical protein
MNSYCAVRDNTLTRIVSRRNQFKSTAEFNGEELDHCSDVSALKHGLQTAIHHAQRTAPATGKLGDRQSQFRRMLRPLRPIRLVATVREQP